MKIIFIVVLVAMSSSAFAKGWSSKMSESCRQKLLKSDEISSGSVQASAEQIVDDLKFDWESNPFNDTAEYSDCGSSDYFSVKIDKSTCAVVSFDQGDSDGECSN